MHMILGLDTCSKQRLTQDHWMCVTAVVAEQLEHHHKLTPCLLQPTHQAVYPLHQHHCHKLNIQVCMHVSSNNARQLCYVDYNGSTKRAPNTKCICLQSI